MRESVKTYIEQFEKILNLSGISWWIIDYEYDRNYFYCNEFMEDTFCLDKNLGKHSVSDTCPIAGDYNKNIELAEDSREKAKLVFDEYNKLVGQQLIEYNNQFPYYNEKEKKTFYFSSRAKILEKNDNGEVSILYGIIEDITLQEEQRLELESLSWHDKLTGLYNRFKLDESLSVEVERVNREDSSLSLILMDLDKFKLINDNFGHLTGDKVLKETAVILKENTRKVDIVGRWGGEEFMIICPHTNLESAKSLGGKLREFMESFEYEIIGKKTGSFGLTQYIPGESIDSFVNRADEALLRAKRNGRNRLELK